MLHNESPALTQKCYHAMNTFNELEELEAFQHRLESARLRRRQLEEHADNWRMNILPTIHQKN
ncbi:MAG UNVERIFIED_CONTAM: hypothetical protein LVR29_04000 [Microcystis novacekii LVE1205-3]